MLWDGTGSLALVGYAICWAVSGRTGSADVTDEGGTSREPRSGGRTRGAGHGPVRSLAPALRSRHRLSVLAIVQ